MFETLQPPPADKILGLAAACRADPRAGKIDLGVGVYKNADGETVILDTVKAAERRLLESQTTKTYLSPLGDQEFVKLLAKLAFGDSVDEARLAGAQTPGGTGALRMLAELIARAERGATIWLPDPSWANHAGILKSVGLGFRDYPYFDHDTGLVDFAAMRGALEDCGPGDVVLLHGCCHNPTGADLSNGQWDEIAALAADRAFTPWVDLAYLGFGDGLEQDAYGLRAMAARVEELLVAISCSKNFALYRERTGAAVVLTANAEAAELARGNLGGIARGSWSMPPDHGAAVVRTILSDPDLAAQWRDEVDGMRARIREVRQQLAQALRTRTNSDRFDFLAEHRGMFSLTGLTPKQVERLREDHAVYIVGDGRANMAGLNEQSIAKLADAIAAVC